MKTSSLTKPDLVFKTKVIREQNVRIGVTMKITQERMTKVSELLLFMTSCGGKEFKNSLIRTKCRSSGQAVQYMPTVIRYYTI